MKKTIYIAGPMRGLPDLNFPAFDRAAERYDKLGFVVLNPAEMDRQAGHGVNCVPSIRSCMMRDMPAVCDSTHIALLPGWIGSRGVRPEAILSHTIGNIFLDGTTDEELDPREVVRAIGRRLINE